MQHIAIDGGKLVYADAGSGEPVVLIHGFPLDHTIWDVVMPQIEPHGRIVRPDLRGLGASSVTPGPYLMETLASDVAALLDALGIERATIVGHSVGGYAALAFYRMYRERVAALALVASRFSADAPELAAQRGELADRVEREGTAALVERFIPHLFAPRVAEEDPALVARTKALIERTRPRGAAAILRGMALRVDSRDLLEEIDVPFLLVAGGLDPFLELDEAKQTANAVKNARFVLLEGVAHMPMVEATHSVALALEGLVEAAL